MPSKRWFFFCDPFVTIAKDLYTLDLLYKPILEIESEMSRSGVPEPIVEDCLNGKKLEF